MMNFCHSARVHSLYDRDYEMKQKVEEKREKGRKMAKMINDHLLSLSLTRLSYVKKHLDSILHVDTSNFPYTFKNEH